MERTTEGWLSSAGTQSIVIFGGDGDDTVRVLKNNGVVEANGDCGDDKVRCIEVSSNDSVCALSLSVFTRPCAQFVLYSFLAWNTTAMVLAITPPSVNNDSLIIRGNEGNDRFEYTKNSPASINGGPGDDLLVLVLTEQDDHMALTEEGLLGAGRVVEANDIEQIAVLMRGGNDRMYALASALGAPINVIGGAGSDGLLVAPTFALAVEATTLRGHSGLLSHQIDTEDPDYRGLAASAEVRCSLLRHR